MKYSNLIEQSRSILENKEQLNEGSFYRLPGHVIGNEFYRAHDALDSFYKTQINGNDFNEKNFDSIIKMLQAIRKEAKKFNSAEEVPVSYDYKKKKKNESVSEENVDEATTSLMDKCEAIDEILQNASKAIINYGSFDDVNKKSAYKHRIEALNHLLR